MAERKRTAVGPIFACEITPTAVIGARAAAARDTVELLNSRALPIGAVVPSLVSENIKQREVLKEAAASVLESMGAQSREVIAILPDAACHVVMIDFDELPDRKDEANAVVRFRLKKALPFDADKAFINYHATRGANGVRVVAAVMLDSVLNDYESLFRELGSNPGVVLPSTISALALVEAAEPTLVLKVDALSSSVAIVQGEQLLLYRTLEHGGRETLTAQQLADDIYPSLVYFEDNFKLSVRQLVISGVPDFAEIAALLQQHTGLPVEEMAPVGIPAGTQDRCELTGIAGALLG